MDQFMGAPHSIIETSGLGVVRGVPLAKKVSKLNKIYIRIAMPRSKA